MFACLCSDLRSLPWLPSFVCGWVVALVGWPLCFHLFVPCAVALACQENVVILLELVVVFGSADRLVANVLYLDFVPKQVDLASEELVVPVVQ